MRSIIRVLISAFAFWLTTLIVGGPGENGVWIEPFGETAGTAVGQVSDSSDATGAYIATLLLVALVFGLVDGTLGRVVRFVSIPLRIITLGLFGLIINGFMLVVVSWLSDLADFGLRVDGFWWGVLGAIVLSVLSGIMNGLLGTGKKRDA